MDGLKKFNVLFLEDNIGFAKNTIELLDIYFNEIFHSQTINKAIEIFNKNSIDIIISDIKVKNGNGLEFIQNIREKNKNIPIIILTSFKDEEFLLQAIPLNISSYQMKPLSYENFINMLQVLSQKLKFKQTIYISNNLEFNIYTKELYENKQHINLTKKESLFMELLCKNKQITITYEMIQNNIWNEKTMSNSAMKNFILRLRKKTNKDFIKTVQGIGYKLAK